MKRIIIVCHKYLPQPDDDLVCYLKSRKKENIIHIKHNFPESKDRRSVFEWYRKGKLFKRVQSADFIKFPEIAVYVKELYFTVWWIFKTVLKWDLFIGMDGLSTFFGLILRKAGLVKKVVYWSVDFVPENRFHAAWKNKIYNKINKISIQAADEVWDLSPRMKKGRKVFLSLENKDYKSHKIVPYGIWLNEIRHFSFKDCQKTTLVFMGHLMEKQGVDLVIKKIPKIVKFLPSFRFKIIGEGGYQKTLISLAKRLKVLKYCSFLGKLSNKKMIYEIAKSSVAIAPYKDTFDNYTKYADSGKVKTYLACGVPVLLTSIPWNAKEIERKGCGLIIKNTGDDLIEKIKILMKPKANVEFRKNAVRYAQGFDYNKIFSDLGI